MAFDFQLHHVSCLTAALNLELEAGELQEVCGTCGLTGNEAQPKLGSWERFPEDERVGTIPWERDLADVSCERKGTRAGPSFNSTKYFLFVVFGPHPACSGFTPDSMLRDQSWQGLREPYGISGMELERQRPYSLYDLLFR